MTESNRRSMEDWVQFLNSRKQPVLRQTVRSLDEARERVSDINAREISEIILRDPMMVLRVLAHVRPYHEHRRLKDIANVEQAVMMLGVEPFFNQFQQMETVEELLKPYPQALVGLLYIVRRSQRAARYAFEWAVWRRTANIEEIYMAALLYDLSEMLMWCYAPVESTHILTMQKADATLRSAVAQEQVFGFRLIDMQQMLCKAWQLPDLLLGQFNAQHQDLPRFMNVKLAVDLARHSARGWDNAALPDDYTAISKLLNLNRDTLLMRLGLRDAQGNVLSPPT